MGSDASHHWRNPFGSVESNAKVVNTYDNIDVESYRNDRAPRMVPDDLHQLASILRDPQLRRLVSGWKSLPDYIRRAMMALLDPMADEQE